MAKTTNAGGVLNEAEENGIKASLAALKAFVASIDEEAHPFELVQTVFKVTDRAYGLKSVIDRATKNANLRQWEGNVRTFKRAVSPATVPNGTLERKLSTLGMSREELDEAMKELGMVPLDER